MNYENETGDFGEDDYGRSDRARRGLLGGLAGDRVAEADHRADDERRWIEPTLLPAVHRPTRPQAARVGKLPVRVPQQRCFFPPSEKDAWAGGDMTVLR
jgi:hypothetical protein